MIGGPRRILFVCTHNAGRSQMASAFFNQIADPKVAESLSAGLEPLQRVHPEVVQVMNEVGIDLSDVEPMALTGRIQTETHFAVTLGCAESLPLFSADRRADWSFPDPKGQPLARVRQIRDEIRALVAELVKEKGWGRKDDVDHDVQPYR